MEQTKKTKRGTIRMFAVYFDNEKTRNGHVEKIDGKLPITKGLEFCRAKANENDVYFALTTRPDTSHYCSQIFKVMTETELCKKIVRLVGDTRFGIVELKKDNQFQVKEFEEGDEMITVLAVETDTENTHLVLEGEYELPLTELTYHELEKTYNAIKTN